jgi:hypothetical protein
VTEDEMWREAVEGRLAEQEKKLSLKEICGIVAVVSVFTALACTETMGIVWMAEAVREGITCFVEGALVCSLSAGMIAAFVIWLEDGV